MTSHELARELLALPDLPVIVQSDARGSLPAEISYVLKQYLEERDRLHLDLPECLEVIEIGLAD